MSKPQVVVQFRPRAIDCDKDTRETLEALLVLASQHRLAGMVVTYAVKSGEEDMCVTGSMRDVDKATSATARALRRLSDV